MKIIAFTGGQNVPSARFRVRQLIPSLAQRGIEMDEVYTRFTAYPPVKKLKRPFWAVAALSALTPQVLHSYNYDLTLIHREMISTHFTLEGLTHKPRILDVDDAIFLYRNGKAARALAQHCELIICGNDYLAENFKRWNSNIAIVPTAIDCKHYKPNDHVSQNKEISLGWIGTSGNLKYLEQLENPLNKALKSNPKLRLVVVSNQRPDGFKGLGDQFLFYPWNAKQEVQRIQAFDIGLMPLEDSDWTRGKCSFKMLQYMACGVPVVVSPVGMNLEVMEDKEAGFFAADENAWFECIMQLANDSKLRQEMGLKGRNRVLSNYNVEVVADQLQQLFSRVVFE